MRRNGSHSPACRRHELRPSLSHHEAWHIAHRQVNTASSELLHVCTDDGSHGEKGNVKDALLSLIEAGNRYDEIFAVGPVPMQRAVANATRKYGIKNTVSMAPLMIDGSGMCGCCRISVGGEMKFACVDGPDFDAHLVDWELMGRRSRSFVDYERHKYEETCNLFKKEVQ